MPSDTLASVQAYFGSVERGEAHRPPAHDLTAADRRQSHTIRQGVLKPLSTKWRTILSMEMRGISKREIAANLQAAYATIVSITNSPRYIAFREQQLGDADDEFINLKPAAVAALRNAITSDDAALAARTAIDFFKLSGYGGHPADGTAATAETVAARLFESAQITITQNNITVERERGGS